MLRCRPESIRLFLWQMRFYGHCFERPDRATPSIGLSILRQIFWVTLRYFPNGLSWSNTGLAELWERELNTRLDQGTFDCCQEFFGRIDRPVDLLVTTDRRRRWRAISARFFTDNATSSRASNLSSGQLPGSGRVRRIALLVVNVGNRPISSNGSSHGPPLEQ